MSTGHIEIPTALEEAIKANPPAVQVSSDPTSERITEAMMCALIVAQQLENPEEAQRMRDKLFYSSVRGSFIEDVKTQDDVLELLTSSKNWKTVVTNLEDKNVVCLQGEIADKYKNRAYAAYVTVSEIFEQFGEEGLKTVNVKKGYQKEGEFYLASILRMPTDVITVQLKFDESGTMELMKQWFVGREKTSIFYRGTGDELVRCSCKLQRFFPSRKRR